MSAQPAPADLPPGGRPWSEPDAPWQPWSPDEVAARLAGVTVPWCIAAGWAMDLFRGEVTKHGRPKDVHDFTGVLPLLDPAARAWLTSALERVHPGHAWLAALGAERTD